MIPPIQPINPVPFGILQEYRKTPYGDYKKGVYKTYRIEVYDAKKYEQKLFYVSDNKLLHWVKSKFLYMQDGVKKVVSSSSRIQVHVH